MAFHIRDPETDRVVRELASLKGLSLTEAVRQAAAKELVRAREDMASSDKRPFLEKIRDIQDRLAAYPKTGLKADKEFYDWLNDEE